MRAEGVNSCRQGCGGGLASCTGVDGFTRLIGESLWIYGSLPKGVCDHGAAGRQNNMNAPTPCLVIAYLGNKAAEV